MSTHTPGPWTIEHRDSPPVGQSHFSTRRYFVKAGNRYIADSREYPIGPKGHHLEGEANARLIAAAPRMLKALQEIAELPVDATEGTMIHAKVLARAILRDVEGR